MTKVKLDPYLVDFVQTLEESQRDIMKVINALKERFQSCDDRKEFKSLNTQVINLIDIIRESDLFKIAMMNTLEREIKRSFTAADTSLKFKNKKRVSKAKKAKLTKDVNDCFTVVNNKHIEHYKNKILSLEDDLKSLREENKIIKEKYEEEFKKNQQKWEQEMKAKEEEYEQIANEKINEYVRKQKIVDTGIQELEEQIMNLNDQNQDLERDKEKICNFT